VWAPSTVPGLAGPSYLGGKNQQAVFTGTPTAAGSYTVTATVEDTGKARCSSTFFIDAVVINPPAGGLSITTLSLPNGQEGTAYSKTVTGTGGVLPYAWAAAGLPPVLSINPATGVISGTPAAGTAGSYNVTITLNDSAAGSVNKAFVLTITAAPVVLQITSVGLPDGEEGTPYSYGLIGQGGTPPYTWSAAGLPAGLSINSVTGTVSGTPAAGQAGDHNVTITLADNAAGSVNKIFNLHIDAAAVVVASKNVDYCAFPPFLPQEVAPNLLLEIDNSSSMYDLVYIDEGTVDREPFYCYDQTYSSLNDYFGYFIRTQAYLYNFANQRFEPVGAVPVGCTKSIPNTLCLTVNPGPPESVTQFVATGNYLNWLTVSKFDIEKGILTGGKYDTVTGELVAESRGCVGRRFLKEALTADYVEGGPNTPLAVTFTVKGPDNLYNPTAPSVGGQTYIQIFNADYNEGACQAAVELYADPTCNHQCRRVAAAACLDYDIHDTSLPGKMKNVFIQAVQECWQYESDGTVGPVDSVNTVKNFCPDIYDGYSPGTCNITTATACTTDADCPATEICVAGPNAIEPGNAALLCGSTYAGACYDGTFPYDRTGFTDDACVIAKHNDYCGDFEFNPAVDPTDDTSATENYGNIPALLGDLGIESQLGDPIATFRVRVQSPAPEGVIQEFSSIIRFGALSFNFQGTPTECVATSPAPGDPPTVRCPKVCSTTISEVCNDDADCPSGETCVDVTTVAGVDNLDGGQIIYNIGDPLGNHNSGLIKAIDDIKASTWTPFAEGFYNSIGYFAKDPLTSNSRTDLRLNAGDFDETKNPSQSKCQDNNILLISDGMSTADLHAGVSSLATAYDGAADKADAAGQIGACTSYAGSKNLDDLAWIANHRKITDFKVDGSSIDTPVKPFESISTYVVFNGTGGIEVDECNSEILMTETAANGGGSFYPVQDPPDLAASLRAALLAIAGKAAAGTAASVLASGEGSGANLIQAIFYPSRKFGTTDIRWIGRLSNFWFFVDPFFASSAIYEDNASFNMLDLTNDNKAVFSYNAGTGKTMASRSFDSDSDGIPDTAIVPDIEFELLSSLWEAGLELWKRDIVATPRKIMTTTDGDTLIPFTPASVGTLRPYLQAANNPEAANIIGFVNGVDIAGYRNRTVSVDLNGDGDTSDAGEGPKVWKLGDVIRSTPRVASRFGLNTYDQLYLDSTYKTYITTAAYRDRGMAFAGANDGMLHAFNLGKLELEWGTQTEHQKARLTGVDLGKEVWSYISKNTLPYLKYTADENYCHIYSQDLSPYVFDASVGNEAAGDLSNIVKPADGSSWRTILIGGMRLGGACRKSDDAVCTDCVKAPGVDINEDSSISGANETSLGLSTYYGIDVTNTLNNQALDPELLWEFSGEDLGFTSTGPIIVKINVKQNNDNGGNEDGDDPSDTGKNGKWFVVFASGPTGPISTADHQFLGRSDQNLKIFILDLKSGSLLRTIDTGITNAFAGSMLNTSLDTDLDYQDDVVYIPYVEKDTVANTWTDGGVLRISTHEDIDPTHWDWSKVIDGIGPVTSTVAKLQNKRKGQLWLYFGTGRYYFEQDTPDDPTGQGQIIGIKEPCYSSTGFDPTCNSDQPFAGLTNVTNIAAVPADPDIAGFKGWYVNLDPAVSGVDRSERIITDPLAVTTGVVFFTSFAPRDDSCRPSGKSFIWAAKYNTGGAPGALLKGQAMLQVSTGSIETVDLGAAFTAKAGRRTAALEGVPPIAQGLTILTTPPPVKRIMHIRER
jgi:type IV pilus assembly protein PilY1